jgi:hypothetical protein
LAWYRETALSEMWISLLEDLTIAVVLFLRLKDLPLSGPSDRGKPIERKIFNKSCKNLSTIDCYDFPLGFYQLAYYAPEPSKMINTLYFKLHGKNRIVKHKNTKYGNFLSLCINMLY